MFYKWDSANILHALCTAIGMQKVLAVAVCDPQRGTELNRNAPVSSLPSYRMTGDALRFR